MIPTLLRNQSEKLEVHKYIENMVPTFPITDIEKLKQYESQYTHIVTLYKIKVWFNVGQRIVYIGSMFYMYILWICHIRGCRVCTMVL